MQEMDALKEICCSQADRVQEYYADSLSIDMKKKVGE